MRKILNSVKFIFLMFYENLLLIFLNVNIKLSFVDVIMRFQK